MPIIEIQNKFNLNKKELYILASDSGIFLTEQDREICGDNQLFYKKIETYVKYRKYVEENNIVKMNKDNAKIFSMLDYTVITYAREAFVTNKYKLISASDLKYIVDSKDREKVLLFADKYYLVPNDVYQKLLQQKNKEKHRSKIIILDPDEININEIQLLKLKLNHSWHLLQLIYTTLSSYSSYSVASVIHQFWLKLLYLSHQFSC